MIKRAKSLLFTVILRRIASSCGAGCRANGFVFARHLEVGSHCHFNGMHVFGSGRVKIGDNFHSGRGLKILTTNHNYRGTKLPYDSTVVVEDVTIGKNVWIGMDVMILGGVVIGDGAIIQARSVVVSSIPPLSIAGGHPARVFGQRDADHYMRLLAER